ncbi:TspO protein [Labilibaculum filiforme]|uniref:TspO protein n=1 Tax=Labilibaculum filiforme TaxID=1940526 RepID=A0A2N3HS51_9BACT|nr:TspO/MBR family protein [Labilibaculum filiforme]PKQ60883.1 TspO protein [Labilibaculum filiforme]
MIYRLIIFLILNFTGLAIAGLFTSKGVPSDWYVGIAKAPWTPPGWVFGAAWTIIMICFSIYMTYLWESTENKNPLLVLFAITWILNVGWSPIFFHYHQIFAGLLVISGLTLLIGFLIFFYWSQVKFKSTLLLPYFLWLLIATSLNGYIFFRN